jgi:hypothetical protein
MKMRPPMDAEIASLPTVIFTADESWDPTAIDNVWSASEIAESPARDEEHGFIDSRMDDFGSRIYRTHINNVEVWVKNAQRKVALIQAQHADRSHRNMHRQYVARQSPDYTGLRKNFGWVSAERVKATLENTSQYYRASEYNPFRHHTKSRFPAANVSHIAGTVATDPIISDTAAANDGILGHAGATMV